MSPADPTPGDSGSDDLVRAALAALSEADGPGLGALVSDDVVIVTAKGERRGRERAEEWAAKRFDHLDRRYRIEALADHERGHLVDAVVEYSWRGEEEVAERSEVSFHFEIDGGEITRIELRDRD